MSTSKPVFTTCSHWAETSRYARFPHVKLLRLCRCVDEGGCMDKRGDLSRSVLSVALSACMVASTVPAQALAEAVEEAGGLKLLNPSYQTSR